MGKWIDFILQDVANRNETKKAAIILRINAVVMCAYYAAVALMMLWRHDYVAAALSLSGVGISILLLRGTYHDWTKEVFLGTNLAMLVWTAYLTLHYGMETGVLNFVFVLFALLYISDYINKKMRYAYMVFLFLFREGLFLYSKTIGSGSVTKLEEMFVLHGLSCAVVCILLVVTMMICTRDSRDMEHKLIEYNNELHRLANKDALTQLENRRSINDYLKHAVSEYESGVRDTLSIAIGDIDFFKKINDIYGHTSGDTVLTKLGNILQEFMKGKGKVGRWGGEEFMFIFDHMNGDDAALELNKLLRQIRMTEFICEDFHIRITMTMGLSEYSAMTGLKKTIQEADEKLYIGKREGRNRIIF